MKHLEDAAPDLEGRRDTVDETILTDDGAILSHRDGGYLKFASTMNP